MGARLKAWVSWRRHAAARAAAASLPHLAISGGFEDPIARLGVPEPRATCALNLAIRYRASNAAFPRVNRGQSVFKIELYKWTRGAAGV